MPLKRLDMYGGANKGAVVPTRVDLDLFDSARLDPMAIRQELGVTEREIILVTVSSLVSRKGIQVALDAIEALLAENELFRYWIVGDGPLRAAFEQRVDPLGDRVRFLGRLPHREVSRILAGADIFVFPSFAKNAQVGTRGDGDALPVVASAVDVFGAGGQPYDGYSYHRVTPER
jgi:glycosyltransferase involved in cell wall biosynthesis